MRIPLFAALLSLPLAFPAGAQSAWYVLSHDDGRIEPSLLMKSRAVSKGMR